MTRTAFGQRTVKPGEADGQPPAYPVAPPPAADALPDAPFGRREGVRAPADEPTGFGGAARTGDREEIHPFEFRGSGSEYFRIWVVNLALTLATVGVYSAWAAVRQRRYFLGNTVLDGHSFDYHANPVSILIGRMVVLAALLVVQLMNVISPVAQLIMIVILLAGLPWLINNGLRFNAAMTSYRNVRFGFEGTYLGALASFILMPLAGFLTLGLLLPVASRMQQRYIAANTRWGTGAFGFESPLGPFYRNLLVTAGFALLVGFVFGILSGATSTRMQDVLSGTDLSKEEQSVFLLMVLVFLVAIPTLLLTSAFYAAGVRNLAFNATAFEGRHALVSTVGRLRYVWILVSNLILTVLTLFFYRPWASVRTWRYLCGATALNSRGSLDGIVEAAQRKGNVGASQYLDLDGFSFGI